MRKLIDMTGWIMKEHGVPDSRLTVLERDISKGTHNVYWFCQCECGNIKSILGSRIRNGEIRSCGCLTQEYQKKRSINIPIGSTFGKLTVIQDCGYEQTTRKCLSKISLCQCDCGSPPFKVFNIYLKNNQICSCGCLKSKGEAFIKTILTNNNIKFKQQYSFNDLRSDKNILLRFDFAILNENNSVQFLIEYDGEQHYLPPRGAWNHYTLEQVQARDLLKNDYCKQNNILLKRIPYTEKLNFTIEDIFSDKYNI